MTTEKELARKIHETLDNDPEVRALRAKILQTKLSASKVRIKRALAAGDDAELANAAKQYIGLYYRVKRQ